MNWKRGIMRLVWTLSICIGVAVLLLGCSFLNASGIINAHDGEDAVLSLFAGVVMFGFVWLIYGLSVHIYIGFQDSDSDAQSKTSWVPSHRFWQWVTGRFSAENDPLQEEQEAE